MANTYGLYQRQFQGIKEIIAYYELGLEEEAIDLIYEALKGDRESFDPDQFTLDVAKTIQDIGRKHGLEKEEYKGVSKKYLLAH